MCTVDWSPLVLALAAAVPPVVVAFANWLKLRGLERHIKTNGITVVKP